MNPPALQSGKDRLHRSLPRPIEDDVARVDPDPVPGHHPIVVAQDSLTAKRVEGIPPTHYREQRQRVFSGRDGQ